jgi:hypothetical protein
MRHVHFILQSKITALKGAKCFLDLEKTLGRFELLAGTLLQKQGLRNWIKHNVKHQKHSRGHLYPLFIHVVLSDINQRYAQMHPCVWRQPTP